MRRLTLIATILIFSILACSTSQESRKYGHNFACEIQNGEWMSAYLEFSPDVTRQWDFFRFASIQSHIGKGKKRLLQEEVAKPAQWIGKLRMNEGGSDYLETLSVIKTQRGFEVAGYHIDEMEKAGQVGHLKPLDCAESSAISDATVAEGLKMRDELTLCKFSKPTDPEILGITNILKDTFHPGSKWSTIAGHSRIVALQGDKFAVKGICRLAGSPAAQSFDRVALIHLNPAAGPAMGIVYLYQDEPVAFDGFGYVLPPDQEYLIFNHSRYEVQ